jgi:hypothetical protein
METAATWEIILVGALAVLLVFLFRPGIKAALERSRNAKKDWPSVLIPLALVVVFVFFLMAIV